MTDYSLVASTLESALFELNLSPSQQRKVKMDLFYTLLRIPERAQDAYQLGRALFEENTESRYPSLVNGLAALQLNPKLKVTRVLSLRQLFGTRAIAARSLTNYLNEKSLEKPRFGVKVLLDRLHLTDFESFPGRSD